MANDAASQPTDGSGVRRRHSAHFEEPIAVRADTDGVHIGTAIVANNSPGSPTNVQPATGTINSTGTDIVPHSAPVASEQPHIRFSSELPERPSVHQDRRKGKKRLSDEATEHVDGSSSSAFPALSVDTSVANAGRVVPVGDSAKSPESVVLPLHHHTPKVAPLSPRTARSRGMSLRSSLFQRHMRDRSRENLSVIEMNDVGPSTQAGLERHVSRVMTGKKNMDTVVEISPVNDSDPYDVRDDAYKSPEPGKSGTGITALPNYENWIRKRAVHNATWRRMKEHYQRARKLILRINDIPPSENGRHLDLDPSRKTALLDERTGKEYLANTIRSSRYTAYNFLPRQLFAQFSKLANFYFLIVSILQMIPGLSTTGTYTTIVPLLFFVMISMAKEGYDDLRRYRLDKAENNRETSVLHAYQPVPVPEHLEEGMPSPVEGPLHWAKTKWQNLQVGDVVRLGRDDAAPADLVLLHSKGMNGIAYIETMALDGETNLKSKQPTPSLAKACGTPEAVANCDAHFVVEDPNLDLYNFEGKVNFLGQTSPLTNNEIIYRGSILRNTPEAFGMVIYSGEECKIRMNANKNPRIKAPALQAVVNRIVFVIVIFVIALAIYMTVAYQIWRGEVQDKSWYLTNAGVAFFPILISFVIMFNTMIPLSLYVSMEIIKLCQMFLLNDIDMYDEASDTPFEARTSTINEELGQISYIFSDKTGTLTDNVMKFRKLSVAGTAWLHDVDLQQGDNDAKLLIHKKRSRQNKGKAPVRKSLASQYQEPVSHDLRASHDGQPGFGSASTASQWHSTARPEKAQPELSTRELIRYLQRKPTTLFAKKARMLILSMALCHTCLPEPSDDGTIEFQASSPDELALVRAAQELDYLAVNRESSTLTIKTCPAGDSGEPVYEQYDILDVIEFSSKRKRMSVIARFPDGRVCLICKGADSIVMNRLRLATLANAKVVEIEKRSSKRKSMEAQQALARKSEQVESPVVGRSSFSRPSITLGRPSMSGGTRLQPIRDELDTWLTERERDVYTLDENVATHYSPRPSTQINGRPSMAASETRSSVHFEDEYEDLVEESLVVDESAVIERCFQHINDFATEGLRTLLYGHRFMDDQEYLSWKKIYLDATTSLVDRQSLIERAGELIEQDLELGGATAIEDKLQHGVPEAIDKLRRANIKMWMLTGDKRETAINIGHSCRLIKDYSSVTVIDHEAGQIEQRIAAAILDIQGGHVAHSVIVVDGQTLAIIEGDHALWKLFLDLAISADSVVCCRASPSQKALLVKAIRRRVKNSITLAIGDGANDIAMIQEAHVGIGITGKEGLQAARTSDYSIAQFRFLTKLLLVHGRWNYVRVCKYTVGTFWKEMMFYLIQALFQRWTGYTGTSLYESWSLSMFNTLFTSLPVIFMGVFEKDLLPSTLLAVPELYTKGQRNGGFNFKVYLGWMFMAASEAVIIFFLMLTFYGKADFTLGQDLFSMGDLCFTAGILLINIKLQVLELHNKSIMAALALVLSIGGWFLFNIVLAGLYKKNNEYDVKNGFFDRFGRNPLWWLTLILTVVCTTYLEIAVRSVKAAWWPTDVDTFQCLERDLAIRKRFEEASATELQAGWRHGDARSSVELAQEQAAQAKREGEVLDLLSRPRVMHGAGAEGAAEWQRGKGGVGVVTEEEHVFVADGPTRRSTDIQEMLSRRFGHVRQEDLVRS